MCLFKKYLEREAAMVEAKREFVRRATGKYKPEEKTEENRSDDSSQSEQ